MATKINTNPPEQSSSVSAAKLDAASKRIGGTTLKMHSMIPMSAGAHVCFYNVPFRDGCSLWWQNQ